MWWIDAAEAATMFAAGDVVVVRARPDAHAAVAARVGIDTALEVDGWDGDWVQVHVAGRPETARVGGWVRREALAAAPATVDELLDRAARDPGGPWLARARALDPGDPRVGAADAPLWLAQCFGERVWLLGVVDGGAFRDASMTGDTALADADADLRLAWLAPQAWYTAEGRATPGRFAAPFRTTRTDIFESDGTPWAAGTVEGPRDATALGACTPAEHLTVFATRPLARVAPGPVVAARAPAEFRGAVPLAAWRRTADAAVERQIILDAPVPSCSDGDNGHGPAIFWQLDRGESIFLEMGTGGRDGGWAQWFDVGGARIGVATGMGLTAMSFVVAAGAVTPVVIREYGC